MFVVMSWDWKEQPSMEEIQSGIEEVFDPKLGVPRLTPVYDGSDSYVLVISSGPMRDAEALAAAQIWYDDEALEAQGYKYGEALPDELVAAGYLAQD